MPRYMILFACVQRVLTLLKGTTDSYGYATVSFTSGTGSSSIGTYSLTAHATSGTLTATAKDTFSVK